MAAYELLGPAGLLVGLVSTLVGLGIHLNWSFEEKQRVLSDRFQRQYFPRLQEFFRDEYPKVEASMKQVAAEVIKAFLSFRSMEQIAGQAAASADTSRHKLLQDAKCYKDVIQEQLANYKQTFAEQANKQKHDIMCLAPDENGEVQDWQGDLRQIAGLVRPFLMTADGEFVDQPVKMVNSAGQSALGNAIKVEAFAPEAFTVIPCHVTRFLLDQWMYCRIAGPGAITQPDIDDSPGASSSSLLTQRLIPVAE